MMRLGLVVCEGRVKGIESVGRVAGPESKAQLGSGTSVPYNSPPLIHAQLLGRIKEPKRHSRFGR